MVRHPFFSLVAVVFTLSCAAVVDAQMVISANDGAAVLVNGVNTVPSPARPDSVTILDATVTPPRVVSELAVPNSVIGPPQNVAIAPDGSIAVVTSSTKIDPDDASRTINDDTVTFIDLRRAPATVVASLRAGSMASGVSFSPDGRLLLVANRGDGTISAFSVNGSTVAAAGTIDLGAPNSGPSHVAFTPNGRMALVTRNNDHLVSILTVDGPNVSYRPGHDIVAGLKPYGLDITSDGSLAVVGNTGSGSTGSVDTIALIDLTLDTPRTVDYVNVGVVPEAVGLSPDGRYVAVTVMNGTNAVPGSATFQEFGRLRVFAVTDRTLKPVTEAPIGQWCQGVIWTNQTTVLAQCMTERAIRTFHFDAQAQTLTAVGAVELSAAPAGIAVRRP